MTLNPGQQIGSEIHRDGDQLFMVLSGTGTATLNLEPHDIGPGSLIAVPAGTRHNVTAGEGAPLRLVTVYSPPQHPPGTVEHAKPAAVTLAAQMDEARDAKGEWVEMYHGTLRESAEKIKREGLTSQKYGRPDYPVLTSHKGHAEKFTRDPDHPGRSFSMVTVRIPRDKLDEYTLDDPAYGRQYGLRALKKPLPPSMIHQVEPVGMSNGITARLDLAAQAAADGPDEPAAAMTTARHLHDTARHLTAASAHLDAAREAKMGT